MSSIQSNMSSIQSNFFNKIKTKQNKSHEITKEFTMAILLRQLKLPKPASSEKLFAHVHMQKHEHIDRQTDSMNLQEGLRKTKATLALLEREAVDVPMGCKNNLSQL